MSLIERIANEFGGAKRTPEGYLCKCPCHDDRTSSLSLKISENGKAIINCFAGCRWEDIRAEMIRRNLISDKKDKPPSKYDGAKFYIYEDLVGNAICRKVKLPNKKMWFERFERNQWISGLEGKTIPLYNLKAVSAAKIVYLCEGEKDAESLNACGLCGTTNHAGAMSWGAHLSEQLRDKIVIIIPDNDAAGRKRVAIVSKALQDTVKELRVFVPPNVPEHGDITDWLFSGGVASEIFEKSVVVEKRKANKKATRDEYFELFESVLNHPRRCIFNEKLMTFDHVTQLWNPSINLIEIVKSEALCLNETRESKFCVNSIAPHFFAFENSKPLEFLVDIPAWDGEERISAMAYLVKLKDRCAVSQCAFSELLKEWCALVFLRLHNPMIQNRILVLQGGQGIGKDTWTSMLVDGLGQFCLPLAVVKEDKDTYLNLHRGLIMKISEFDKTAKTEVSTLKDIITTPATNLRAPYDKDAKLRFSRCSFISSANAENLLRDSTGNRRFLIFEIEEIEYAYAGWSQEQIKHWQMQCLAEMRYLADVNYEASAESWRQMRLYIERQTPTDAADDITEIFLARLRSDITLSRDEIIMEFTDQKISDLMYQLSRETGIRTKGIKTLLQSRIGIFRRAGDKRHWALKIPPLESAPSVEHEEAKQQALPL